MTIYIPIPVLLFVWVYLCYLGLIIVAGKLGLLGAGPKHSWSRIAWTIALGPVGWVLAAWDYYDTLKYRRDAPRREHEAERRREEERAWR